MFWRYCRYQTGSSSGVFDQNRETPILFQVFRVTECIVQNSCPAACTSGAEAAKAEQKTTNQEKAIRRQMHVLKTSSGKGSRQE
jgi:hypothetical protein